MKGTCLTYSRIGLYFGTWAKTILGRSAIQGQHQSLGTMAEIKWRTRTEDRFKLYKLNVQSLATPVGLDRPWPSKMSVGDFGQALARNGVSHGRRSR